jgi:tetratricopeptide (TPR) repeat protein
MAPLYLAEGYSAIGNSDKAISVLNKAILQYVREARFSNLVKTRFSSGDYSELHKSLKDPYLELSDQILPRTFAKLLVMKGDVDPGAREVLTFVLHHHPSDPDIFDDLCANGHYDEALRILTEPLRIYRCWPFSDPGE